MGDEGREQARREWKVRREDRDQEVEKQQQARLSAAEQEAEQERLKREQEVWSHKLGRQDGGGGRNVLTRIRELRAMPYGEYLRTPHWKHLREDKVRAAGHRCQLCNRGSVTLNVHHRTYERLGEELDEDLTVLCRDCHNIFYEHGRLVR